MQAALVMSAGSLRGHVVKLKEAASFPPAACSAILKDYAATIVAALQPQVDLISPIITHHAQEACLFFPLLSLSACQFVMNVQWTGKATTHLSWQKTCREMNAMLMGPREAETS